MQFGSQKLSQTYESHIFGETKKRYAKITPQLKKIFLSRIVFQNLSIKEAAQSVQINYSSAKAIASIHKKQKSTKIINNNKKIISNIWKQCSYKCVQENQNESGLRMITSSIGGHIVSQRILPKRKLISKIVSFNLHKALAPETTQQV